MVVRLGFRCFSLDFVPFSLPFLGCVDGEFVPFMCGMPSSPLLPLELPGEVLCSAFAVEECGWSRSLVYWFLPTRPRFAGGRPVFLWEGLGSGGVGVAKEGRGASGFRLFDLDVARGAGGSGDGSESGYRISHSL